MSGIACAVDTGTVVQLVTGKDPADSWDEYHTDPMFHETAKALSKCRGDSVPFLFAATDHVYGIPRERLGLLPEVVS